MLKAFGWITVLKYKVKYYVSTGDCSKTKKNISAIMFIELGSLLHLFGRKFGSKEMYVSWTALKD
jgi:hypothetical protein